MLQVHSEWKKAPMENHSRTLWDKALNVFHSGSRYFMKTKESFTTVPPSLDPVFREPKPSLDLVLREPKPSLDLVLRDPKSYFEFNSKFLIGAVAAVGLMLAVKCLSRMTMKSKSEDAKSGEEAASEDQGKTEVMELQHQQDSGLGQEHESEIFNKHDGQAHRLDQDSVLVERKIILEMPQMTDKETSPELQKAAVDTDYVLLESVLCQAEEFIQDCSFERAFDLISNHPVFVKLDLTRAHCLVRLERYEHAKNILLLMNHTNKDNAEVLVEFGFLHASAGKFKLARTNFEKALLLSEKGDPIWERARIGLNVTQRRKSHCSLRYTGLRMRAQCCTLSEQKKLYFRGKAHYDRGKYSKAKECFEQSIAHGIYEDVLIRWAFCCMELGLLEEALEVFKESDQQQALVFVEKLLEMTGGRCPYVVLGIPRATKEDAIRWKYQELTAETKSAEELARIHKAFVLLNDRVFRLEYEGLRREMAHLVDK